MLTVFIPLRPFLVSYITERFGPSPVNFGGKGKDPERIMVKLSKLLRPAPDKPVFPDRSVSGIEICINRIPDFDPRTYNYLSPQGCRILQDYIYERVFMIHFLEWMDQVYDKNDQVKYLITEFCDTYSIREEDITYETLKKRFYRFRESRLSEIRKKYRPETAAKTE